MKKRAFVRYTKNGKIVPGSLVFTYGSYPEGPALYKEIPYNLCCQEDPNPPTPGLECNYFISYLDSSFLPPVGVDYKIVYNVNSVVDAECNTYSLFKLYSELPPPFTSGESYLLVKYDDLGNVLWETVKSSLFTFVDPIIFNTGIYANMAIDSENNLYLSFNGFIVKINGADGSEIWTKSSITYNIDGVDTINSSITGVAVNSNDELFITMMTPVLPRYRSQIIKLDKATGDSILEKTIDSTIMLNDEDWNTAYQPFTDKQGNVYVFLTYLTASSDNEYYGSIIKFDNNLNYISNVRINAASVADKDGDGTFIGFDLTNNLYITSYENMITKVNSSGSVVWSKELIYNPNPLYIDEAFIRSLSKSGNIYYIKRKSSTSDIILIKIDTNGNLNWATEISDSFMPNLFGGLWVGANPVQLVVDDKTADTLTITIADGGVTQKGIVFKLPATPQISGVYGTTTFTPVTSDFSLNSLTPTLEDIDISITLTTYYNDGLLPAATSDILVGGSYVTSVIPV
jgi:hypothetical protein